MSEIPATDTTAAGGSGSDMRAAERDRLLRALADALGSLRLAYHQTCASITVEGVTGGPAANAILRAAAHVSAAMLLTDRESEPDFSPRWVIHDDQDHHLRSAPAILVIASLRALTAFLTTPLPAGVTRELQQASAALTVAATLAAPLASPPSGA